MFKRNKNLHWISQYFLFEEGFMHNWDLLHKEIDSTPPIESNVQIFLVETMEIILKNLDYREMQQFSRGFFSIFFSS